MSLIWTPTITNLSDSLHKSERLVLILCPFITRSALEEFINETKFNPRELKVVTSWKEASLASGASDPEIYPFLRDSATPLHINNSIHLKLFVTTDNRAYVGSANITHRGLGLSKSSNIEAGTIDLISEMDWIEIYKIIEGASIVTDELYHRCSEYSKENKSKKTLPKIDFSQAATHDFTLISLPATKTPQLLWLYYNNSHDAQLSEYNTNKFLHDIVYFDIPQSLSEKDFYEQLRSTFTTNSFVSAFTEELKNNSSMSFGAVSNWIHNHCRDVPLPYRYEIKESVNTLYNWLSYFYREISWEVPGKRSQVMIWREIT